MKKTNDCRQDMTAFDTIFGREEGNRGKFLNFRLSDFHRHICVFVVGEKREFAVLVRPEIVHVNQDTDDHVTMVAM